MLAWFLKFIVGKRRWKLEPVFERNQRVHPRIPIVGHVKFESTEKSYSGYLANISRSGLLIKARDVPSPNQLITLSFWLLPSFYISDLQASVVWVAPQQNSNDPRGMGVRFVDLDQKLEKQIEKYIGKYYQVRTL
jgi:uncharacterized protein (TIGR02266 family)